MRLYVSVGVWRGVGGRVCVCVRACVSACVRARACVCACVCVFIITWVDRALPKFRHFDDVVLNIRLDP